MIVTVKPYRKRDNEWIIYMGNDRGVSVGVGANPPAPYGKYKFTQGQHKLWALRDNIMDALVPLPILLPHRLDSTKHVEPKYNNFLGELFVTDTATVCGLPVGADGIYLYRNNALYKLGQTVDMEL